MSLLFISQVIYEHGELWLNNINKEKLLIRLQEPSGNHTNSHLVAKQDELAKEIINLALQSISFIVLGVLYHAIKTSTWGKQLYCPSEGRHALWMFIDLKNP
jgi:hypothetical protein